MVKNKAFTLAEVMITLVIFSIATAGLLLPFASSAAVQQQGCDETIAAKLACDLVEEIISRDFALIVPTYGSYSEAKGNMKSASGLTMTDSIYANFSRKAVCEYIYMPQQGGYGTPNFIRVTVRVYLNGLELAEVVRIKSK